MRSVSCTFSLHEATIRDPGSREVFPVHHSPSGPPFRARRAAVFSRLRFPRPTLRGTIAPVVLVCGILAGIALVLPSYAPAVTGADGALGTSSTRVTSTGVTSTGA